MSSKIYLCEIEKAIEFQDILKMFENPFVMVIGNLTDGDSKHILKNVSKIPTDASISTRPNIHRETHKDEHGLSQREQEVLTLIAEGLNSSQVSEKLFISTKTVNCHKQNIKTKLGCKSDVELVRYAIKQGLVQL